MRKKYSVFVPQQMKTSRVLITSYTDQILEGEILSPLYEKPLPFVGMVQFLQQMERIQDELEYPQANEQQRSFVSQAKDRGSYLSEASGRKGPSGKPLASFQLTIMFRQNASWQGNLVWEEREESAFFRSVLELMMLFDSALPH